MFALLTVLGLVVAACGGSTESPSASVDAGKADYKACLSLDTGGPADKNFNQSAYEGLEVLKAEGFQTAFTTAVDDSSYSPNIQQLVDQGCNTVIAVGFNQGTALQAIALDPANAGWTPPGRLRTAPFQQTSLELTSRLTRLQCLLHTLQLASPQARRSPRTVVHHTQA
jgi:hypothetical protein